MVDTGQLVTVVYIISVVMAVLVLVVVVLTRFCFSLTEDETFELEATLDAEPVLKVDDTPEL